MQCPRCRLALTTEESSGFSLSFCTRCSGVMIDANIDDLIAATKSWVPLANLSRKLSKEAQTEIDLDRVVYLLCPGCSKQMARHNFGRVSGVIVDRCSEHGIWFDQTELARVIEFLQSDGHQATAEFEAREASQLAKQRRANTIDRRKRFGRHRWRAV